MISLSQIESIEEKKKDKKQKLEKKSNTETEELNPNCKKDGDSKSD